MASNWFPRGPGLSAKEKKYLLNKFWTRFETTYRQTATAKIQVHNLETRFWGDRHFSNPDDAFIFGSNLKRTYTKLLEKGATLILKGEVSRQFAVISKPKNV